MKRMDMVASIIIIAFSTASFAWLIPCFIPNKHDAGDLPPSFMPLLSVGVCTITAILLGISAWRGNGKNYQDIQENDEGEKLSFGIQEAGDTLVWIAFSGITWLLLKFVGFEVAAGAVIAIGALYGGIRNLTIIIIAAIIIPQIIDKAVWYGLQIILP